MLALAEEGETEVVEPLPLNLHLQEQYTEDLPALLQRRYIRVLTTVNRTNFYLSEGELAGFEYSLLRDYQDYLNQHHHQKGLKMVLEFIPVSREELLPKLVAGYGDIAAAGLTITPERLAEVDFTIPYLREIDEVVVTHHQITPPQSLQDLAGVPVMVRPSSSYFASLQQLNQTLRQQKLAPVQILPAGEEMETEQILELVNSGSLAYTVADSHLASIWAKILPNIVIHPQLVLREGGEIAWMVRQQSPELLQSLNRFLQTRKKGALHGNLYFKQYYQNSKNLQDPTDVETWQKIADYKAVMKHYAAEYGIDWLLILAQAFQESRLNHETVSPAGAVGVMQLLPSTAADRRIAIDDISSVEANIHAGVKYLALLRDNYFSDEAIRPRDQIRLALAAYNAGPAKINRLRKEAEKMGLNPNRWFRHVEFAALKHIGQETVAYVSNINRYYVLYQALYLGDDES
ncbi:lytic transglycosylase F [Ectothiorhodospiraceae bacterium BW-2]|nr:lytic transglycosylase F [Ectothiorhodospiraceae bacterium BW-2]